MRGSLALTFRALLRGCTPDARRGRMARTPPSRHQWASRKRHPRMARTVSARPGERGWRTCSRSILSDPEARADGVTPADWLRRLVGRGIEAARARESRHSGAVSRLHGTVQQGPVQRQKTQIVQSCMTLDDFLP